jgi:hypothetical protein
MLVLRRVDFPLLAHAFVEPVARCLGRFHSNTGLLLHSGLARTRERRSGFHR